MNIFSVLSEGNDDERILATQNLIQTLMPQDNTGQQGLSSDIQYTVKRLVQGLASSRKFARVGYSTALCQLLRVNDDVHCKYVLDCIEAKFQSQKSGKPSKSEIGNVLLGKVFGLLTLIQSKKLYSDGIDQISMIVQQFLNVSKERSYLQQLCIHGIAQIISQVDHDMFKQHVLPHIESQLAAGWAECTPDRLLLILFSSLYHRRAIKKFLKEFWLDKNLVSEKTFPLISDVVMRSTCNHPIVHSAIDRLILYVKDKNLDVIKFWKSVCHPLFELKGNTGHKRVLGLYMFEQLLPCLDTVKKVESVVHADIVNVLVHFNTKKTDDVAKRAKITMAGMLATVKASVDPLIQIAFLKCLMTEPGLCLFDRVTNSGLLADIITTLLPEAKIMFVEELMKAVKQQNNWIFSKDHPRAIECMQWCIRELTSAVFLSGLPLPWQLSIMQLVLLKGFFTVTSISKEIVHCDHLGEDIPQTVRKCVIDNFFKTLSKLVTQHLKGQSRLVQLNERLDLIYELVQYTDRLMANTEHVCLVSKDVRLQVQIKEEWKKLTDVLKIIDKKRKLCEKVEDSHMFELLFIYTGLQLFTDTEAAIESLKDLPVCYQKSNQRRKSKSKADDISWIDVIVELLLSMMCKDTALSRNVAKVVMETMADHVTPEALQLIIDALQQTNLDSEEGMLELVDDDEEIDQNMENADDNSNEKTMIDDDNIISDDDSSTDDDEKDDDKDDESSDSDIEEESNINVSDALKLKVKAALGDAAADSDDDSDDDVELSDSEMFKLDNNLAAAFRSMRKDKKMDKKEAKMLIKFKLRVLDLVSAIVKHHPTTSMVKALLVPLLVLMEGGKKNALEETLGERATNILHSLVKTRKIIPDMDANKNDFVDLLAQLIKFSSKVSVPGLVTEMSKACILIVRILLDEEEDACSPLRTRSMCEHKPMGSVDYEDKVLGLVRKAVTDTFHRKPGHCSPALFHLLFERFPVFFWPLTEDLIRTVAAEDVKVYQKTQAASILANMITKPVYSEIGSDTWMAFVNSWKSSLSKVIMDVDPSDVKKMYMQELILVCSKIHNTSPDMKVLDDTVIMKLEEIKSSFSHACNSMYKKLVPRSNSQMNGNCDSKKKKKKRRQATDMETDTVLSPIKKAKIEDHSDKNDNNEENGNQSVASTLSIPAEDASSGETDKKRKKHKRISFIETDVKETSKLENAESEKEIMTDSTNIMTTDLDKSEKRRKSKDKKRKSDTLDISYNSTKVTENVSSNLVDAIVNLSEDIVKNDENVSVTEGNISLTMSSKKQKKKKRKSAELVENGAYVNGLDVDAEMDTFLPATNKSALESCKKEKLNTSKIGSPRIAMITDTNSIDTGIAHKSPVTKFSPRYTRSMRK